ncbi:hypothetical protein N0V87_002690 [Didymella glomerata]|uniref:Uncharacterized protein n=1 Tax=Didymella glomerata TaxID=749621 RepID=A0A9W9C3B8_9PLEO|nr:hypothetical protein N0V87_002690 [Didymella glomerata]
MWGRTDSNEVQATKVLLWDRKTERGFPETKVLKQRVRDHIDPKKDLGHSDVGGKKKEAVKTGENVQLENVKVDGKVEKAAEDMVRDMELEDVPDKTTANARDDAKVENVKVDGRVEKAAEDMVRDTELEDVPDETTTKTGDDAKVEDVKMEDVRVDGKVEKAAEDMVRDMELEDVPDQTSVKRNPDGTICEDCN